MQKLRIKIIGKKLHTQAVIAIIEADIKDRLSNMEMAVSNI